MTETRRRMVMIPRSIRRAAGWTGIAILFLVSLAPAARAAENNHVLEPNPWMILPFILFLVAIAVMPFIAHRWWEKYYPHVSIALGSITVVYYLVILGNPGRVLHIGLDYLSFICLIGSLFVAAGGMHITLRGYSTPNRNLIILLIGAVTANFIGTTGASMVLIRPYIRNNKYRLHPYHIVFFIFIVSNIGGALTPIGDPPLFLGYLRGIPFLWVFWNVWYIWLFAIILILAVFWVIDEYYFRKVPASIREELVAEGEKTQLEGMHNWIYIVVIIAAVFIESPPFLREAIMIGAALASYFTTRQDIHEMNEFNFHPIREVAFLFIGIFATMIPALDWLELNSARIGIQSPGEFYWGTGLLSAFLDNAPTYLNFLSAAIGLYVTPDIIDQIKSLITTHGLFPPLGEHAAEIQATYRALVIYHSNLVATNYVPVPDIQVSYMIANHPIYISAISIAAVFFGATTYIGNGPNFMVKSIAQHMGARVPSFHTYILKYTIPILIPIFFLTWLIFFSGGG